MTPLPTEHPWISTASIIPEIGEPVEVLRNGSTAPLDARRYGRETNRYLDDENGRYVYDVTHWRPRTEADVLIAIAFWLHMISFAYTLAAGAYICWVTCRRRYDKRAESFQHFGTLLSEQRTVRNRLELELLVLRRQKDQAEKKLLPFTTYARASDGRFISARQR